MNTLATQNQPHGLSEKRSGLIARTKAIWTTNRDPHTQEWYLNHTTHVTGHPDGLRVDIRIIPHVGIHEQ
jgi:hypothetical protein